MAIRQPPPPGLGIDKQAPMAYNEKAWMGEYSSCARAQRAAGWWKAAPPGIKLAPGAPRKGGRPRYRARVGRAAANESGTAKGNAFRLFWGGRLIFG